MKKIVCEMCGNSNLVRQEGVFVCQYCGTKYSVEEMKKMMIEGTVEVQGSVKIDDREELEKLYQAARNAREVSDTQSALCHYMDISAKNPNCWEAQFYLVLLKTHNIKNAEIEMAAGSIAESLPKVFQLIRDCVEKEEDQKAAVRTVVSESIDTAQWLTTLSQELYEQLTEGNGLMMLTGLSGMISGATATENEKEENANRWFACARIVILCADLIEDTFGVEDQEYRDIVAKCLINVLSCNKTFKRLQKKDLLTQEYQTTCIEKIRRLDPERLPSMDGEEAKKTGCYVATCVYGSYDCPQVWTLRRFRDDTLGSTWYGRLFIRTYYAISPTLVKWFGKTDWFKRFWQPRLDRLVERLNREGVKDTPYYDRKW